MSGCRSDQGGRRPDVSVLLLTVDSERNLPAAVNNHLLYLQHMSHPGRLYLGSSQGTPVFASVAISGNDHIGI